MTPTSFMALAERIDEVFLLIGGAILLIEIAEALFKGNARGKTFLEMIASASTQIPVILIEVFVMAAAYGGLYVISYEFISWEIPITWWSIALALVLADLTYYWEHRIAHEVRVLWTQHAVHHSSRDYNIVTAIRFGPLEGVWAFIVHVPLVSGQSRFKSL